MSRRYTSLTREFWCARGAANRVDGRERHRGRLWGAAAVSEVGPLKSPAPRGLASKLAHHSVPAHGSPVVVTAIYVVALVILVLAALRLVGKYRKCRFTYSLAQLIELALVIVAIIFTLHAPPAPYIPLAIMGIVVFGVFAFAISGYERGESADREARQRFADRERDEQRHEDEIRERRKRDEQHDELTTLILTTTPNGIIRRAFDHVKAAWALLDPFLDEDAKLSHQIRVYDYYKGQGVSEPNLIEIVGDRNSLRVAQTTNERKFLEAYRAADLHNRLLDITQEFAQHGTHSESMDALLKYRFVPQEPWTVRNRVDDLIHLVQEYVTKNG